MIVLDVDSKDVSGGVSSPPEGFVEKQFLANVKQLLKDSGEYPVLCRIWLIGGP